VGQPYLKKNVFSFRGFFEPFQDRGGGGRGGVGSFLPKEWKKICKNLCNFEELLLLNENTFFNSL